MGFGTLFIGYFLLLNISYYDYTDAIAAMIILLALYKLSTVNRPFKQAAYTAVGFAAFGIIELLVKMYGTFAYIPYEDTLHIIMSAVRCSLLLALLVLTLTAMAEVAREVGLNKIAAKCTSLRSASAFVYSVSIMLELSAFIKFESSIIPATLTVATIVATVVVISMILIEIYRCYMRIYMPGEEKEEKKSRFGFMEKFEKRQEEAAREYAEYKLDKLKKRREKRKKK